MTGRKQIVECVPNFSEGRNLERIEKIIDPFRKKEGVKLKGTKITIVWS